MDVEEQIIEQHFEYLDEKHSSLIEDATRFFSLTEQHSQTDYASSLQTQDLYMTDEQVEKRIDQHLENTRKSIQEMDAAITKADRKLEELSETTEETTNYTEFIEKKRWYKEKYIQITEELSEIEDTPLAEKTGGWNHQRVEYNVTENNFEIEIGHQRKASKQPLEGDK